MLESLLKTHCLILMIWLIWATNNSIDNHQQSSMSSTIFTTNNSVDLKVIVPTTTIHPQHKNVTTIETSIGNDTITLTDNNRNNSKRNSEDNEKVTEGLFYKYKIYACRGLNISECTCKNLEKYIYNPPHTECVFKTNKSFSFENYNCTKSVSKISYIVVILLISVAGIIGNLFVVVVRIHHNCRESLHYQLISSLAAADLCFSVIHAVAKLPDLWSCYWIYGLGLCKIFNSALILSSSIGLGFILIIAIERYMGIVRPFTGGISDFKVYIMIGVNILSSLVMSIPPFLVLTLNQLGRCNEDWTGYEKGSITYGWCSSIFFFILPIVATSILYYQSIKTLKSTIFRQEMLVSLDEHSRKKLLRENKRILRIISTILITFLVLVGPNHVMWLLVDNAGPGILPSSTMKLLFLFSSVTYSLHATVNPIIYSIIDKKFRRNILYMVRHQRIRKLSQATVTSFDLAPRVSGAMTTVNL